jgi:hypothetical protein
MTKRLRRNRTALPIWSLLFLFSCASPSFSADILPFSTRNLSPLAQIYGLPGADDPLILPHGRKAFRLTADLANHFARHRRAGEDIILDGETFRATALLRSGCPSGWEWSMEIPYLAHGGGGLDSFIEGWHDLLGISQGGRDRAPRGRLLYRYVRNGTEEFNFTDSSHGLGDIRLAGGRQVLYREGGRGTLAIRASLKLPTGSSSRFLGSGSTDLALWGTARRTSPEGRLAIFGAAGVLGMTKGDILPDQQRRLAGFGTLGGGWAPWERVILKVQLDGHTALYRRSGLPELGEAVLLTMGGTIVFTERTTLDLAVVEDLVVGASPDVVFHLSLRTVF